MSLQAFFCNLLVVAVAFGATPVAALGDEALPQAEIDRRYEHLIELEKARTSRENLTERLASGLAALGIGLYGYYNDDRGLLTKVIYSATQTAGIVMVSGAILDANQPSLLLLTDRYLARRRQMDLSRFKRGIVLVGQKRTVAEYKQLAYTSAILASVYGYDAYREKSGDEGLKNVFYFLTFNFTLIAAANFYRLATHDYTTQVAGRNYEVRLALLPVPTVILTF